MSRCDIPPLLAFIKIYLGVVDQLIDHLKSQEAKPVYLGKSARSADSGQSSDDEQKQAHYCTIRVHRLTGLLVLFQRQFDLF
jgi:hypothetical protein